MMIMCNIWLRDDGCSFLRVKASLVSDVTLWWDDSLVRRLFISHIYRFINKLWFRSDTLACLEGKKFIIQWSSFVNPNLHPISLCRLGCIGSKKVVICCASNQTPSGQQEINDQACPLSGLSDLKSPPCTTRPEPQKLRRPQPMPPDGSMPLVLGMRIPFYSLDFSPCHHEL